MGESKPKKSDGIHGMNVYQKLAAITGKIGVIDKGGTNKEQHYSFIEYAAVAGKLRALFAEYGVVIVPRMADKEAMQREEITTKYGNKGVAVLIDFKFEIINADKPDDKFGVTWTGEAADYGDKATNKAATSALKYYLMRQFNISEKGEEDADAQTIERGSEPVKKITSPKKKPALISKDTLAQIYVAMTDKGIEIDDTESALKKLSKAEDVTKINAASGDAILTKIKSSKGDALRQFVYAEQGADASSGAPEEPAVEDSEDEASEDSADVEPEEEPIEITEDLKTEIFDHIDSFGISAIAKMRFLKDTTGYTTAKAIKKDEDWRILHSKVMAILNGEEDIPGGDDAKSK